MANYLKKTYLFYITFLALFAIFPVMTDYAIQIYGLLDIDLLTPPDSILNTWAVYGSITVLAITFIYFFNRKNQTDKLEYLAISVLRYSLVFVMVITYGYCKIMYKQFEVRYSAMDMPLRNVSDFDLTWYYYGKSNIETLMLGLFEFIPGLLLLSRRTTPLGAFILLPVLANVMLVDNFNYIDTHLNIFSILFFLFDIGILLFYRREIAEFFSTSKQKLQNAFTGKPVRIALRVAKIIFIVLVVWRYGSGIYKNTKRKSDLRATVSKCFGIYNLESIAYNNKACKLDSLPNYWKRLYFERLDSRDTRLKDKNDSIINIVCSFHADKDSITIITYKEFDKNGDPIALETFNGRYMVTDDGKTLSLDGKKNDKSMKAIYKNIPIDRHDWWW